MQTRTYADRWKYPDILKPGYLVVPTVFLRNYSRLKPHRLTHAEAVLVLHLMEFKWDSSAPFPSYDTLAKRMGISTKTVRRHAHNLEAKGFLKRVIRAGNTNRFELAPLFDKLLQVVKDVDRAGTER